MECATPDKPEVFAITAKMGWDDPDLTVGKLFRVWRWFDQQTTDGNAVSVTAALLDRIAGVSGFANAMQSVGWLTINDAGISLSNFENHNGVSAKARAQTAKRVANHRASEPSNASSNAPTVTPALAREEKRREELTEAKASVRRKASKKCPESFEVVDADDWIRAHMPGLDWQTETAKFRDHEFAKPKTDWLGAWRNWMREAFGRKQQRAPPTEGNYARQMREKYEQITPMIAAKPPGAKRLNPMEILDGLTRSIDRPNLLEMQSGVRPGLPEPLGGD